jgi:hypothetical protein
MKPAFVLVSLLIVALVTSPLLSLRCTPKYVLPLMPSIPFALAQEVNGTGNQTQVNVTTYYDRELSFDRAFYNPVKVMISYPYTHNTNVTDITTIGFSSYKYDVTPTSITFIASEIDILTFTVQISYDNASLQNVLITVWQGDLIPEGYTWTETASTFVIHFRLNVTTEPSYPSDAEVAAQVVAQLQATFQNELEQQRETLAEVESTQGTNTIMTIIAGVVSILALLLAGFGVRKRRMIPAQETG